MFDITYSIANFTREFNGVKRGKATKTEWCLLGLTAAFLCLLLVLSHTEQVPLDPGVVVETETEVPQEEVAPPFEPVDLNTADEAGAGHASRDRGGVGRPYHCVPGGQRSL